MKEFPFYRGKRILVTGFTGFLGSEILRLLEGTGCVVRGVTRKKPARTPRGKWLEIIEGRIDDHALWPSLLQDTDVVFHLASQTGLAEAQKDLIEDFRANVSPMIHMMDTAKALGKNLRIVFAGTDTEAGIPKYSPLDEKHPDHPITVYDAHKLTAEQYLKLECSDTLRGVSLRLCNLYGPGPFPQSSERGVLNRAVLSALKGETLHWYRDHDFVRDYLYITDAAWAFLAAGEKAPALSGKHFVIGSGRGWKFSEAFAIVAEKTRAAGGPEVRVESIPAPESLHRIHSRNVVSDSRAFSKETGWSPETALPDGIEKLVAYTLKTL